MSTTEQDAKKNYSYEREIRRMEEFVVAAENFATKSWWKKELGKWKNTTNVTAFEWQQNQVADFIATTMGELDDLIKNPPQNLANRMENLSVIRNQLQEYDTALDSFTAAKKSALEADKNFRTRGQRYKTIGVILAALAVISLFSTPLTGPFGLAVAGICAAGAAPFLGIGYRDLPDKLGKKGELVQEINNFETKGRACCKALKENKNTFEKLEEHYKDNANDNSALTNHAKNTVDSYNNNTLEQQSSLTEAAAEPTGPITTSQAATASAANIQSNENEKNTQQAPEIKQSQRQESSSPQDGDKPPPPPRMD